MVLMEQCATYIQLSSTAILRASFSFGPSIQFIRPDALVDERAGVAANFLLGDRSWVVGDGLTG